MRFSPYVTVEKISPRVGLKLGTARSAGQRLTFLAAGAPFSGGNLPNGNYN